MSPFVLLGGALALSLLANAALVSDAISKREEIARIEARDKQAIDQLTTASKACSSSIDNLAAEEKVTRDAVAEARAEAAKQNRGFLTEAKKILSAPPANPADLCASADKAITDEIRRRRAASAAAATSP